MWKIVYSILYGCFLVRSPCSKRFWCSGILLVPKFAQVKLQLPSVSLLLIESEEEIASTVIHKDSGLHMELRGMSLDMTARSVDVAVMVHLEALTLEDRARPDDSPYR